MSELERYSIVWQGCRGTGRLAERFHVPGYEGYLPFFISGKDLEAMENRRQFELKELHLLKGILYGLDEFDHDPKPWHNPEDRDTLLYLLDILGQGFRATDPEFLILNIAHMIREENGSAASRVVLEVGTGLVPTSSKIKSDLLCDTWVALADDGEFDQVCLSILQMLEEIDLNDLHDGPKQVVCLYGLCALVFLGRHDEVESYLKSHIDPYVTLPEVKEKVRRLLEDPQGCRPAELIVR